MGSNRLQYRRTNRSGPKRPTSCRRVALHSLMLPRTRKAQDADARLLLLVNLLDLMKIASYSVESIQNRQTRHHRRHSFGQHNDIPQQKLAVSEISPPSLLYNGNGFRAHPHHADKSNSARAPHDEPLTSMPPAANVSPPEYITHTPEEPARPPNSAKASSMKSAVQEEDGKKEMVFPAEAVLETPEGVFGLLPPEVTDKIVAPLGRMDRRALMATNSKDFEIVSDCVATIVTSRHDRSLLNPSREIVYIHPEAGTLVRGFYFAVCSRSRVISAGSPDYWVPL